MSEEEIAVVETETTPDVPEEQQPEAVVETPTEETDETGVPVKNRLAEANRKLRRAEELTKSQAQDALLQPEIPEDEAINIVKDLARKEAQSMMEPLIVKQFLHDNPDAANMVDDINRIRLENPELSSVDKLDLAYKIAKAEKQDEIVSRKVELQKQETIEREEKSNQSAIEGSSKRTPAMSLDDKIQGAKTLAELQELEKLLR